MIDNISQELIAIIVLALGILLPFVVTWLVRLLTQTSRNNKTLHHIMRVTFFWAYRNNIDDIVHKNVKDTIEWLEPQIEARLRARGINVELEEIGILLLENYEKLDNMMSAYVEGLEREESKFSAQ